MNMLNGVGMGDAGMKKCQLIKRLTNQGYNLQVMAVNCVREFLTSARNDEERAREEYERQQKEKDRILRRIMNTSVRFMGMGFRQALQWTVAAREAEIALMAKQRGIMRRIDVSRMEQTLRSSQGQKWNVKGETKICYQSSN